MFTILFTAVGRRVELIKAFRKSFRTHDIKARVIGADLCPEMAAAGYFADAVLQVPRASEEGYADVLLDLCHKKKVDLLIPLFEPEFPLLEARRSDFTALNCTLLLPPQNTLAICGDKWQTYHCFRQQNIVTPESWLADNLPLMPKFPLFGKPRAGMGSIGAQKIISRDQLEWLAIQPTQYIFQEYISGIEYTLDILSDLKGRVLSVVPRERLEVRSGEVSKSRTVDRPDLMEQGKYIAEMIGVTGVSTLQCIDAGQTVYWTEMNPRFGGGVPLAIRAGVDYPYLLYRLCNGETVEPFLGEYRKGLTMLRYDEAVYF